MKKVLAIITGGTISSKTRKDGISPDRRIIHQLHHLLKKNFHKAGCNVDIVEPWGSPGIDSSDINIAHWVELSSLIYERYEKDGLDGILVLHGTDTMAYTSSWLSICFADIPIPVILTGSQFTLDSFAEDAIVNLRGAILACCSDMAGVWIYFDWKLIPGSKAHKSQANHPDAYIAINANPIYFDSHVNLEGSTKNHKEYQFSSYVHQLINFNTDRDLKKIQLLKMIYCMPGLEYDLIGSEKALILVGFGAGNVPHELLSKIIKTYEGDEKPLVISCSQAEQGVKKGSFYKKVGISELIQNGFTVLSQSEYPLEMVYALVVFGLINTSDQEKMIRILKYYLK